jgi:tetratricopeptide (TPR) repeat protein
VSATSDYNIERLKLIYEFNKSSPLFAFIAAAEIEHGNINDAIKILEAGLLIHPKYPTAYFILALAKAYAGESDEAIKYAMQGSQILGSDDSFEYYEKKIYQIISERNSIQETKRPTFTEEQTNPIVPSEKKDEIEELAGKLIKAKIDTKQISKTAEELNTPQYNGKIISETLAEIYVSQKNYELAISTYYELMLSKPEKIDFFENRIEEIKMMTGNITR